MEIPSRGLSSNGAAVTRKGRAARTSVGEKYISARSDLTGDVDSKRLRQLGLKAAQDFHFIHTKAYRDYTFEFRVVGYEY